MSILKPMEDELPTCRLCSQLEQTLRSANQERTDLLGLTEAGKRNRTQQREERIQEAEANLARHLKVDHSE